MDRESHNHNPYPAGWPLMDQLKMPTGTWQERKTLILYVQPFYWFICTVLSSVHVGGRFNLRFTLVAEVISPNNCCWTVAVVYLPGNTLAYARSLRLDFASLLIIASVSGHTRYRSGFSPFREGLLCHSCALWTLLALFFVCLWHVDCVWFCWLVAACVVKLTPYVNPRTTSQNALFHKWVADLSQWVITRDPSYTKENVKLLLKQLFLGVEDVTIGKTVIKDQLRHTSNQGIPLHWRFQYGVSVLGR